jgi:hypothetical protein
MQIHEITQSQLAEGVLGDLGRGVFQGATGIDLSGNPAAKAAASAQAMTAKGLGPGSPKPSDRWEDKYKAIQQDPSVKQYAANVAQTWLKHETELAKQVATQPAATPTTTTTKAATLTPPPGPAKPGQMSARLAASKTGQKMQQMFGAPKGGIQGMKSDLEEAPAEYTTPGGIVVPAGTKTDAPISPVAPVKTAATKPANQNQYLQAFKQWSDQTLATRVPATGETITMDKVDELPGLGEKLTQALNQVAQTKGTPKQAQAIQNYVMLATAGIQALAQASKNKYGTVKTNIGLGTQELANLKALARTPAGKDLLKKELGL